MSGTKEEVSLEVGTCTSTTRPSGGSKGLFSDAGAGGAWVPASLCPILTGGRDSVSFSVVFSSGIGGRDPNGPPAPPKPSQRLPGHISLWRFWAGGREGRRLEGQDLARTGDGHAQEPWLVPGGHSASGRGHAAGRHGPVRGSPHTALSQALPAKLSPWLHTS